MNISFGKCVVCNSEIPETYMVGYHLTSKRKINIITAAAKDGLMSEIISPLPFLQKYVQITFINFLTLSKKVDDSDLA